MKKPACRIFEPMLDRVYCPIDAEDHRSFPIWISEDLLVEMDRIAEEIANGSLSALYW